MWKKTQFCDIIIKIQIGICFIGGMFMEIVLLIIAILIVCVAVFLKGKAWNSFVDDLTKKDKSEDEK